MTRTQAPHHTRWPRRLAPVVVAGAVIAVLHELLVRAPGAPDLLLAWIPNATFVREQLLAGRVPLWNPYVLAGHPFLAELVTQVFYPPTVLLLLGPVERVAGPFLLLHLAWLALGTWRLARAMGGTRRASVIAGVLAGLSPLGIELYAHPNLLAGASWVPWCWAAAIWVSRRPRARTVVKLAAVLACSVLAGAPELTLFAGAGVAAVIARRSWRRWRVAGLGAGALGLGAGLSAIGWIPFVELWVHSDRRGGVEPALANDFALRPRELLDLVLPFTRFDGAEVERQTFQAIVFAGSALLVLAIAGARRRWGLALTCLVLVALALGDGGGLFWALRLIPGPSLLRYPIKFLFPVPVLLAVMAAAALSRWERSGVPPRWRWALAIGAAAALGSATTYLLGASVALTISLAWAAVLAFGVLVSSRLPASFAAAAILLLAAAEAALYERAVGTLWSKRMGPPCAPAPELRSAGRVLYDLDWNEVRAAELKDACALGVPNANVLGHVTAVGGFTSLAIGEVRRMVLERPLEAASTFAPSWVVVNGLERAGAYDGEVVLSSGRYAALRLRGGARAVLERDGQRIELMPDQEAPSRLRFALPTRGAVHTRPGATLIVRDPWYPGWRARADGREVAVERRGAIRAVPLRGDELLVELSYEPWSFTAGWIASALAVAAALVLLARRR